MTVVKAGRPVGGPRRLGAVRSLCGRGRGAHRRRGADPLVHLNTPASSTPACTASSERTLPRVYARPVELRLGQSLSLPDLIARLNDLGYAERALAETPGEFAVDGRVVAILPRGGDLAGRLVRVTFPSPGPQPRRADFRPWRSSAEAASTRFGSIRPY